MYGILLIIILVITGGAIAFIGDRLGSKVGKKKLSVLGLRPKHTSILVTILTGIAITTLTLGVMAVSSENVRTALFGIEKLNQSMLEAKQGLAETSAELAKTKAEQQISDKNLQETRDKLVNLQQQTTELSNKNQQLHQDNQALEQVKADLEYRNDKLVKINVILEEGNERLNKNNQVLEERNRDLSTGIQIMREGDITFRAGEILAAGVIKGQRDNEIVDKDLEKLIDTARYVVTRRVGSDAPEAEKEIWIYQPEYTDATQFIAQNEGEYVVRVVAAGNLIRGEAIKADILLYKNKTVYENDEQIIEKKLKFNPREPQEVENALRSFLQEVNKSATNKGMLPDSLTGTVGIINGEQFYGVMAALEKSDGNAVITAFADGVADVLGPLRINLKLTGIQERNTIAK